MVVAVGEALVVAEVGFATEAEGDHATVYETEDDDVDNESYKFTCNEVLLPDSIVVGFAVAVI